MSKYKVGDKFVIEIEEVLETETRRGTLYRTGFSTLVFDDYGLDCLKKLPEEDEPIRIGDEVTIITSHGEDHGIVFDEENGSYNVLWSDRTTSWDDRKDIIKTGRNFKYLLDEMLGNKGAICQE